jgi:hypothetical protein
MMMNFTVDCVRGHKDGVLLLITADAGARIGAVTCVANVWCVTFFAGTVAVVMLMVLHGPRW